MAIPSWQTKRSFEETNGQMLTDGTLSDVTFLVGGDDKTEEVKAHKFILASRSPVFYAMFCDSLAESSNSIKVTDIEPEIFRAFLRFVYTEQCTLNGDNVMQLLYCAKKYETNRLVENCRKYLDDGITVDNACVMLQHANTFDEAELEKECFAFVLENGEEILQSDGFSTVSKEMVKKIVESDELRADELSVYEACKRWAMCQNEKKNHKQEQSSCDLRAELGDMLYSVRFPTMSLESFASHVAAEDILSPEEKVCVFKHIAGVSTRCSQCFFDKHEKRKNNGKQSVHISRFYPENITTGWNYGGGPDVINFRVSTKARLIGVKLFAPCDVGVLEGVVALQDGSSTLASKSDVKIKYEKSKINDTIIFDKAQTVEPGKQYTLNASLKGPSTFHGGSGEKDVSSDTLVVTFYDNDKSTNRTNVNMGQFEGLIFEVYTA